MIVPVTPSQLSEKGHERASSAARRSPQPVTADRFGESWEAVGPNLVEGETRMCMMGPSGVMFETDFHLPDAGGPSFSVLWLNTDASGFMDETKGDRIVSVRRR